MEAKKPWLASVKSVSTLLLLLFTLAGCKSPGDHLFTLKPYLFSVKGGAIGAGWQYTDAKAASKHSIDLTLFEGGTVTDTVPARRDGDFYYAFLPIPACDFGKAISYQVSGMAAPRPIEEIPCADNDGTAKFTFLADSQEGPGHLSLLVDQMEIFPGSAIIHGGDIVQTGGKLDEWLTYFGVMDRVGGSRVTFPAVGNHEYRKNGEGLWRRFFRFGFREARYSFRIGPAEVFVINSCFEDDPSLVQSQVAWLQDALARSHAKWKLVAFHHAAYSYSIGHHWIAPKKEHLAIRRHYVPHFEHLGVQLVLNGHVHLFERSFKDGVHYLNAGPAGGKMGLVAARNPYAVAFAKDRTVTHLEVGNRLIATTVNTKGQTIDQLAIDP